MVVLVEEGTMPSIRSFATESKLVELFVSQLRERESPWPAEALHREFDYYSGVSDVICSSAHQVLAFEAKLKDWRKALHQAWRNTSFANRVYVVLPRESARAALCRRSEFAALGVGLCLVDDEGIEIAFESQVVDAVIPWLHKKAKDTLRIHGTE
jgi:hypothetical protein